MLPVLSCDQVAHPAVSNLVGNDIDQGTVSSQERRGDKGQARVLHTTVGERGREDQEIIATPIVGGQEFLTSADERLSVNKLPCGSLNDLGFSPDSRAGSNLATLEVSDSEGDQVRGHTGLLVELVGGGTIGLLLLSSGDGGHDCAEGCVDVGAVGQLDRGAVLAGDHGAGVDGLALGKEVRVLLANSLAGFEPLAGSALLSGGVTDNDLGLVSLGKSLSQLDGQGRAVLFMTVSQSVLLY